MVLREEDEHCFLERVALIDDPFGNLGSQVSHHHNGVDPIAEFSDPVADHLCARGQARRGERVAGAEASRLYAPSLDPPNVALGGKCRRSTIIAACFCSCVPGKAQGRCVNSKLGARHENLAGVPPF